MEIQRIERQTVRDEERILSKRPKDDEEGKTERERDREKEDQ